MRTVALLVLLAVLPTAELVEQLAHVVEHALEADVPDHAAHHEGAGDEHGCTGLIHLCSCHHAQATVAVAHTVTTTATHDTLIVGAPPPLHDLHSLEPAYRPPIA